MTDLKILQEKIDSYQKTYSFMLEKKGKKDYPTYQVSDGKKILGNFIRVTEPLSYFQTPQDQNYHEFKNQRHIIQILRGLREDLTFTPQQVLDLIADSNDQAKAHFVNAGNIGTAVHSVIENPEKREEILASQPEQFRPQIQMSLKAFDAFSITNNTTCIAKELKVFSKKFGICGTIDDVSIFGIDNDVIITDWKTGQYKSTIGYQLGAYGLCFRELFGITPHLRATMLDKRSGSVKNIDYVHNDYLEACYIGLLQAYAGNDNKSKGEWWPYNHTIFHKELANV